MVNEIDDLCILLEHINLAILKSSVLGVVGAILA